MSASLRTTIVFSTTDIFLRPTSDCHLFRAWSYLGRWFPKENRTCGTLITRVVTISKLLTFRKVIFVHTVSELKPHFTSWTSTTVLWRSFRLPVPAGLYRPCLFTRTGVAVEPDNFFSTSHRILYGAAYEHNCIPIGLVIYEDIVRLRVVS